MNLISTLIFSVLWVAETMAIPLGYYRGDTMHVATLSSLVSQVKPGMVVIIGEKHYQRAAQAGQMNILEALKHQGYSVSVGMEFISYPKQAVLDFYKVGRLTEAEFVKETDFKDFTFYRDQVLFPQISDREATVAINAPRQLTSRIAKVGIEGLTEDERFLMPPGFQMGQSEYKKRFAEAMGGHVSAQVLDNYFAAQSVWDDTMAWQTAGYMAQNPGHVFVIIVGEFHLQYGGGLPDRLRARGINSILTLSQVDHNDYSDEELEKEVKPHPQYGPRADFIWIF
ncbi:MAG: ChaN family lipoprotein [Bdellovibrionaceae bacterium]|nr:ChaN family lipoprotein [Pseudobdellovibrionaceae bacterium]